MNDANYRKHNDRTHNSSTYHKKDGTPVRSILKREAKNEIEEWERPDGKKAKVTPNEWHSPEQARLLEEVVVHGIHPDLDGFWDESDGCWYLTEFEGRVPNWEIHRSCIEDAGGIFEFFEDWDEVSYTHLLKTLKMYRKSIE